MDGRRLIAVWYRRARQSLCSHRFYTDDLKRINDDLVRCPCFRCGKVCEATYGLALDGSFVGYRPKEDRPPNRSLCFDCGAAIIAADDEALVCVQCGGRNRRVGHRIGSNPPPPTWPSLAWWRAAGRPGPDEPSPSRPPWRNPSGPGCRSDADRQERHESAGDAGPAGAPAPPFPGSDANQRHDTAALDVASAGDVRLLSESGPGCAPLSADVVRQIVREEIERAMRPTGKSGRMGPG